MRLDLQCGLLFVHVHLFYQKNVLTDKTLWAVVSPQIVKISVINLIKLYKRAILNGFLCLKYKILMESSPLGMLMLAYMQDW